MVEPGWHGLCIAMPVSAKSVGDVASTDPDDRVRVVTDFLVDLGIEVRGGHDYAELPVPDPGDQARDVLDAHRLAESVALGLQGELNSDAIASRAEQVLADGITAIVPAVTGDLAGARRGQRVVGHVARAAPGVDSIQHEVGLRQFGKGHYVIFNHHMGSLFNMSKFAALGLRVEIYLPRAPMSGSRGPRSGGSVSRAITQCSLSSSM